MVKFKIDLNKTPQEQIYWDRLTPEAKRLSETVWNEVCLLSDAQLEAKGYNINPKLPKRNMIVDIPDSELIKKENLS